MGAGVLSPASIMAAGNAISTSTSSHKKGLGVTTKKESRWLDKIEKLNIDWFYSWGSNAPEDVPEDVQFMPMIWGYYQKKTPGTLDKLHVLAKNGDFPALMGFNEPDQKDQSNMAVEKALDAWPTLMELGVPLASPGCVHPDREWMIEFMEGVEERNLRVDYVCVHSYGGPSAKHLLERLNNVYMKFGRPIWLTEFAVGDWTAKSVQENKHSPEIVAAFMQDVLPMLDEAEFVDRYAWFPAGLDNRALGTSALFDQEGELTKLGKIYAAHPSSK